MAFACIGMAMAVKRRVGVHLAMALTTDANVASIPAFNRPLFSGLRRQYVSCAAGTHSVLV